jgi:hypothetical protein
MRNRAKLRGVAQEPTRSAWDREIGGASPPAPTIFRCVAQLAEHRPVKPRKRVQIPPT